MKKFFILSENSVQVFFAFLLIACASISTNANVFDFCELSRILHFGFGINRLVLPEWMCLIQAESNLNASLVNGPFRDGTRRFGLYQISDGFWCSNTTTPGQYCNVTCEELVGSDLRPSVNCAKDIFNRYQDFNAWDGWVRECKNRALPNT
jgi:lysozyme C